MFFILLIIGLIIAIIVLTVRYLYVQAHILSTREFRKAAERQSFRAKAKSHEITCDYCGYVINTAKEKRCPNCGAVYGNDKELRSRFDVNEAAVEEEADAAAKDAVLRAHEKALESLRYIRTAIIALVCVFVLTVIYAAVFYSVSSHYSHKYRGNEELQDNSYTEYTLLNSPEVTIFDEGGVTLRVMKIYADNDNGKYDRESRKFRIAFSLVNSREEAIRLSLKCNGVNGRSRSRDSFYIAGYFKAGADVLFYENIYGEWYDSVDEIVIGKRTLAVEDADDIFESHEMETFKLNDNGYTVITDDADAGSVIFENDVIRIRSLEKENRDRGYDIWIDNLSDHDFYIDTSDFKINGKVPGSSYILYDAGLPAHYTLHHDSVHCPGEEFENRAADAKVEISFSFSDPTDPANDFSTGYISLD